MTTRLNKNSTFIQSWLSRESSKESEMGSSNDLGHSFTGDASVSHYWNQYLKDYTKGFFPNLTGIRPEKQDSGRGSTRIDEKGLLQNLLDLAAENQIDIGNAITVAWGAILFQYAELDTAGVALDVILPALKEANTSAKTIPVWLPASVAIKSNAELLKILHCHRTHALTDEFYRPDQPASEESKSVYSTDTAIYINLDTTSSSDIPSDETENKLSKYEVLLTVRRTGQNGLFLHLAYAKKLLNEASADAMLRQIQQVALWLIKNPGNRLGDAVRSVSTDLLAQSNTNPATPAQGQLLHYQFEEFSRTDPHSTALKFVEQQDGLGFSARQWTYQELNTAADHLAAYLRGKLGNKSRSIIPILMDKSPELYISILGILKAGAAWCPIDTMSPISRQHDLIRMTDSNLLLVDRKHATTIPIPTTETLCVESVMEEMSKDSGNPIHAKRHDVESTSAAYLIFTSGTTGLPKGVLVSHNAAVASMSSLCQVIPGSSTRDQIQCMQFSQQTFDVFVQDLFYTWSIGGTVISASRETMAGCFSQIVNHTKATHAHLTPAFGATLERSSCPTLEVITMIGERLPQNVADDWGTDIKAFNTYGPAEAAVVSTVKQFRGQNEPLQSSNIGVPLPTLSCYVLRENRPVLLNGIGELALAGPQLADCYLNNESKTSERFVWNQELNQRLYLTGDIVRSLSDGTLDFVGREDDLVKLQGIRVELSEISFALRNCHETVNSVETMHLSREDRPAKVLVTFIAARHPEGNKSEDLRLDEDAAQIASRTLSKAKTELPSYMQPSVFLVLDSIPQTASAKIDRKALQALYDGVDLTAWELSMGNQVNEYSTPNTWTPSELNIIESISKVTGIAISMIHRSSVLPALGIDSIVAGSLIAELRRKGSALTVTSLLQCRTVEELLARHSVAHDDELSESRQTWYQEFETYWRQGLAAKAEDISRILPATPLQEGLITESLTSKTAYWSSHALKIPKSTDLDRLQRAWLRVASITEALRTFFMPSSRVNSGKVPVSFRSTFLQLVHSKAKVDWKFYEDSEENLGTWASSIANSIASACVDSNFERLPWAVSIFGNTSSGNHTMLLTLHHSLHDEMSLEFLLHDVRAAYNDPDRIMSPRAQLSTAVSKIYHPKSSAASTSFYEEVLTEYKDVEGYSMPDLTGLANPPSRGTMINHTLSEEFTGIAATASELEVSVATLFRAAFAYMLLQYLEINRIVIGDTISARVFHPELGTAIAPLVSVVPLAVSTAETVRQMLTDIESSVKASRNHRHVPAKAIRRILKKPQGASLYPAVFAFHSGGEDALLGDWERQTSPVSLNVEHSLALNVQRSPGSDYILDLYADRSKFGEAQLRIIAEQVAAAVKSMIRNVDGSLADLYSSQCGTILSKSVNSLYSSVPRESLQHATFWLSRYAKEHPQWNAIELAEAINPGHTKIVQHTYSELDCRSNQWARLFSTLSLHGSVIAVCLPRCLDLYAVTVAIMKSGNTYLPIDEGLPRERKALLVEDSHCQALVVDTLNKEIFEVIPSSTRVIDIDETNIQDQVREQDVASIQLAVPEDNAYLLYTSGSTGKPKGVLIPHRGLCGFVAGLHQYIGLCSRRPLEQQGVGKWLGLSSRAFDVHLCEMFLGWRLGLSFATAPREVILDDLKTTLLELGITHAAFVPSLLDQAGIEPNDVPKLAYFSVGGEKVSQRILQVWGKQQQTLVLNAYGPTEVSIGCCAAAITPQSTARNVGRPFGNSTAHVLLLGTTNYAIKGQSGELCITGDLVGTGYLDRPDAKGFIEDFNGERMFRTGDVVRMLVDGTLEYLGRSDDQAKIRGQRIELGEVTQCLQEACVDDIDITTLLLQHPDLPSTQLVCFVAPFRQRSERYDSQPRQTDELSQYLLENLMTVCKKRLPAYMVPNYILPVTVLPLAPVSGKVDAKILKALYRNMSIHQLIATRHSSSEQRAANEGEKEVMNAIAETLHLDGLEITPTSNIFEMGLDSLAAIDLSLRLRRLGYETSLGLIFKHPTIEDLARLPRLSDGSDADNLSVLTAVLEKFNKKHRTEFSDNLMVQSIRPCLPLQEGMISRSLNNAEQSLYIHHVTIRVPRGLHLDAFKEAWYSVVRSTPVLRTHFHVQDKAIFQVVHTPDYECQYRSLVSNPEDDANIIETVQKAAARSISEDLLRSPPVRLAGITKQNGNSYFCISLHHALYDHVSLNLVLNDLYRASHNESRLLRTPFDHILAVYLSQSRKEAESFWKTYLKDSTPTIFDKRGRFDNSTIEKTISIPLQELKKQASRAKITLTTLCQTIFGTVLAKYTRSDEVIFGVVLSGRAIPVDQPEIIAGPCITTIPQRLRLTSQSGTSILDFARQAQSDIASLLQHQHTSLRDIHQWLQTPNLFDSLVQYLSEFNEPPEYEGNWDIQESSMPEDYPLNVQFQPETQSDRLVVNLSCTSAFGTKGDAEYFLEELNTQLQNLSTDRLQVSDFAEKSSPRDARNGNARALSDDETTLTAIEVTIRSVISDFTGIGAEDISRSTSLFRLGIDSVAVLGLAKRLRSAGILVRGSELMQYSSVGLLGWHLEEVSDVQQVQPIKTADSSDKDPTPSHNTNLNDVQAVYSCTPLQAGMLTAALSSDESMYMHQHIFKMSPDIDLERLQTSWSTLQKRLDILRTSFHYDNEAAKPWTATVHWNVESAMERIKIVNMAKYIRQLQQQMVFNKADAFATPPLRATVVEISDSYFLILSIFHALYDGLSLPKIMHQLAAQYEQIPTEDSPPFYEAARLITADQQTSIQFWIDSLKDYHAPPKFPSGHSFQTPVYIEQKSSLDMAEVIHGCRHLGITIQTAALVAYSKVLATLYKQRDIIFGHVVSGRSLAIESAENIVGPLFNTVPMRVRFKSAKETNHNATQALQEFTGRAQEHQQAPLQAILKQLRQSFAGSGSLINALFLFQKAEQDPTDVDGLFERHHEDLELSRPEYALNFELHQHHQHFVLAAASYENVYGGAQLRLLVDLFDSCFVDIIRQPDAPSISFPSVLRSLPISISQNHENVDEREPEIDEARRDKLELLKTIVSELSGVPASTLTSRSNIYTIGLDSILAIKLASMCRQEGLALSVADIIQGETLIGICSRIKSIERNDHFSKAYLSLPPEFLAKIGLDTDDIEGVLPCLSGQIFQLSMSGEISQNSLPTFAYVASQRLDLVHMRQAWDHVRSDHSTLRTVIHEDPNTGLPIQIILKTTTGKNTVHEVSQKSAMDIYTAIYNQAICSNSLTETPVRLSVLRQESQDVLLLSVHHSLYDHVSLNMIMSDLENLYNGNPKIRRLSFEQFVQQYSLRLDENESSYWQSILDEHRPCLLRYSRDEEVASDEEYHGLYAALDVTELEAAAKKRGIPAQAILILGYSRHLSKTADNDDPAFGHYISGRSSYTDGDNVAGPCLNILPMVVHGATRENLQDTARQIQLNLADRSSHEQANLHEVLDIWRRGRSIGDAEHAEEDAVLFNTFLNILWDTIPSRTEEENLFKPLDVDYERLTELKPIQHRDDHKRNSYRIDGLASTALFVDIHLHAESRTADLNARSTGGLMSKLQLQKWLSGLRDEIKSVVSQLLQD